MGLRSNYAQKYLKCLEDRRPHLENLLYRLGFSWEDACDAAQEAIIEAVKIVAAGAVESLRDRWAWLRTVAIRKAQENCRSHWQGWVQLDPATCAVDSFADEEQPSYLAAVRAAVDRLPMEKKDLVIYCYLEGHTYTEAVERFNVSLGVVSRRLREARDQLRSELSTLRKFCARADASI